jgi:RNA recognition motif-containing protein
MEHKTIKVSYARPKCDETRGTNLYIRNLPGKIKFIFIFFINNSLEKYDENKLIELFSPHGEIIQARVIRDQSTESPRGIAFVIMGTRSQAQRAGKRKFLLEEKFKRIFLVECLNGQIIDHQRPLLVKFADDDKRRRQLMTRYLPQIDTNISSLSNSTNLRDPSDVLTAQMAQLNLIANGNNSNDNQQQGQDMNLLMNTLLMMPFWSNMCAPTIPMPVLYPNGVITTQNKNTDRILDALGTKNGAYVWNFLKK